jgi:hypothetical protein
MGMSAYLAKSVTGTFLNGTAFSWPSPVYFALFTAQPVSGVGGTEASYTGYARVSMTPGTTDFTTVTASGETQNAVAIAFPQNTGSSETVVGYGLYDASTSGNLLTDNLLTTSQTINTNATPSFAVGAFTMTGTISP